MTSKNRIRIAIGEPPACPKPTHVAVNYVEGITATVTWEGEATSYNLDVNGTVTNNVTSPYTLDNLELGTDYAVMVQANCSSDQSEWSTAVSFTTDACMPTDMIIVNYALTDSYGDGWNNNYILVVDETCNIVDALTIASGSSATGTVKVCGSYAQFLWYKGSYPDETSWVFTDQDDNVLFEGAGNTAMANYDVLYTIDLNPYSAPVDVEVSEVGPHSAKVSWTETDTATAWQIGFFNTEGELVNTVDATTKPYILTGLTPETAYTVNVRATGANGTSLWPCLGYSSFTTDVPCPAPTNLNVTHLTATSATLNWEGWGSQYNVRYATEAHGTVLAEQNFDNSDMGDWTTIDADGDGFTWVLGSAAGGIYLVEGGSLAGAGHESSADLVTSGSFSNYTGDALTPDNYLVSPQVTLGGTISFWACGQDASYPAEHFGVAVSTTVNDVATAFTTIWEETMAAKGGNDRGNAAKVVVDGVRTNPNTTRSGNRAQGTWYKYTVDLSAYSGQGYVAIRHFNCTDMFMLNVDDIVIESAASEIQWTELTVTDNSLDITGMEAETEYMWQVQANCGDDGMGPWTSYATFTTGTFCDTPFDLEATDVTYNAATLNWYGSQESYNVRYRTAEVDDEYYFTNFNAGADASHAEGWNWEGYIIYGIDDPIYGIDGDDNYFLQMGWATTNETYIFSPELPEYADGSLLEFYYLGNSVANTFEVGYSSTTNDTLAFTWSKPIDAPLGEYTLYSEVLPAGTKYVAFKATAESQSACIFIDNFRVYNIVVPAGEWIPATVTESTYALTGLTPKTEYEWQVEGINSNCDDLKWSDIATFTTLEVYTQTIALVAGWNYVSFNLEITMADLQAALQAAYPDAAANALTIKSKGDGQTAYNPFAHRWIGSLTTLDLSQMYKVKVPTAGEIEVQGSPIDPAAHPATIKNGANWIAFPLDTNMTVTEAFAGFPTNGDIIKIKDGGQAQWNQMANRWIGTLTTLVPGKGYIYNSKASADKPFTFPSAK